jgi:hypothetical protein
MFLNSAPMRMWPMKAEMIRVTEKMKPKCTRSLAQRAKVRPVIGPG